MSALKGPKAVLRDKLTLQVMSLSIQKETKKTLWTKDLHRSSPMVILSLIGANGIRCETQRVESELLGATEI